MAKILIAEDERDIRELVAFSLRFLGKYDVTEAGNGVEAVERATAEHPDLILMDVRMPRMTGYEACKKLKENDETKNIPVIFLSAKGQDKEIQQGINAGAEEYILKPFESDDLLSRVRQALERSKASQ
jgi:two-component system alkaline phosphatase synthesis response regulator PhoP